MVVVMAAEATEEDADGVVSLVRAAGGEAFVSRGESRTIIGLSGDIDRFAATLNLASQPGVSDVVRISVPYKLVSREHRRERSVIRVGGVPIGPDTLTVIAGPCAVETPEQTLASARMARAAGASLLRGGAYKPRSSPYAFQGLGEAGLKILADVRAETGLPIVTEVVSSSDVDLVASYADMLQVGTRNMQNFPLLQAVGGCGKPVMLKRGMSATIEEWLMAAEYIAQRGNLDIVLCERGIRTFENATRNTLDISAVPVAQRLSPRPRAAAVQGRDRRRRGRHHRRRAPVAGDGALRRAAGAHRHRPAGTGQRRAAPVTAGRPHAHARSGRAERRGCGGRGRRARAGDGLAPVTPGGTPGPWRRAARRSPRRPAVPRCGAGRRSAPWSPPGAG
jgi:3-deoxy-7-phosphoheptulonate synthase